MRRLLSPHVAVVGLLGILLVGLGGCAHPQIRTQAAEDEDQQEKDLADVRTIGELTTVDNVQPLAVSGVGVVTGLAGTGGSPKGFFRTMLEDQLRKQKPLLEQLLREQHVKTVVDLLDSPDNALVLVAGMITPGSRKGDKLDLEVSLPPQSRVTSLRGGMLQDCVLYTYNTTRNIGMAFNPQFAKPDQLLKGPIVAQARGALVVGLGDGDDEARVRRGHIWEGGVCLIDRPFCLVLNSDRQFKQMLAKSVADRINKAAISNAVAERINGMYQDDAHGRQMKRLHDLDAMTSQINTKFPAPDVGRGEMAQAVSRDVINIKVPYEYRLNSERYLLVVRLVPLHDSSEVRARYRHRLEHMLLDPSKTIRAALRLEALGKDSVALLKNGLSSEHVMVRFACAEALAYLGSPACAEELAQIARDNEKLRSACLRALASLDEAVCHRKLAELMAEPVPDLRYGAFLALHELDDRDLRAQAEQLNEAFWLHRVAPNSPPMIHLSTTRRAEIVFFGQQPSIVPPVKILAGPEFTITSDEGADQCVVSRFLPSGKIYRHTCTLQLEDVIHTMADMGGQYPDVVDLLRKAEDRKCLNCAVNVDTLPLPSSVVDLARAGRDLKEDASAP